MSTGTRYPLQLSGDLTVQTAAEQKIVLLAALEAADGIDLNLSEVAEMDTAGLQLLVMLKREAEQLGKTVNLLTPSGAVLEVLELARLDSRLEPTEMR